MTRLDIALYVGIALLVGATVYGLLHGADWPAMPEPSVARSADH